MIELFFIDPGFQQIAFRKFSRSWDDDTEASDIIIDVFDYMTILTRENSIEYEESDYKMNFVMPYWTPQQAISYITQRAKGKKSGNSGYLCYNNTYKDKLTTNLFTIDYLMNDEGGFADDITYVFSDRDISSENKILEWYVSGTDKLSHGFLRGGKFLGYDWNTKTSIESELKYSDAIDGYNSIKGATILGKKTLFPDIGDEYSNYVNLGESDEDTIDNIFYSEWIYRYNLQNAVNVTLYGHEKRFAGQLIDIQWPSSVESGGSFIGFNKSWKGQYLIKSITHSFVGSQVQKEAYLQKAVLIKNGYTEPDVDNLYKSKNIKSSGESNIIVRNS